MTKRVGILNSMVGNLRSVLQAFEHLAINASIVSHPSQIQSCSHLVLPGVGSFKAGQGYLEAQGLIAAIDQHVTEGKPLLGICLGMHLMADSGFEFGTHKGLSLINGEVKKIPAHIQFRLPHVGWNEIIVQKENGILKAIPDNTHFYFSHSYFFQPKDETAITATCQLTIDFSIPVCLQKDNIFATQFHPEKSHQYGLKLLSNFVALC